MNKLYCIQAISLKNYQSPAGEGTRGTTIKKKAIQHKHISEKTVSREVF